MKFEFRFLRVLGRFDRDDEGGIFGFWGHETADDSDVGDFFAEILGEVVFEVELGDSEDSVKAGKLGGKGKCT